MTTTPTTYPSGPPVPPTSPRDTSTDPAVGNLLFPGEQPFMAESRNTEDSNRRRLRLRRRLLLIALPVVLAMVIVGAWLLSLSATAALAIQQYERSNFAGSAQTFGTLLDQNHVETWIPYYDRGAALAGSEDYIPAIDDFEKALTLVPEAHKCEVVVNLALGWERLADGYAQAGLFDGAILLYQNSADVLAGQDCTPPQQPVDGRNPGQELKDAGERVQSKLDASKYLAQQNAVPDQSTPEGRLDQLKQQDDGAAGQKADGDSRDRAQQGPGGFATKPW